MIVYSWDGNTQINDGVSFAAYFVGQELGLPEMEIHSVARHGAHPFIGGVSRQGVEMMMEVEVLGGSADTLRAWFDNEDATPKVLVVTDEGGTNARYLKMMCVRFIPTNTPYIYLVTLRSHGDVRLRSVTPTSQHWDVTASGATVGVSNGTVGVNDEAYPIVTITPRAYATGANNYRRFITVRWRASSAASRYPVDIVNAGLDTRIASTNFASANGYDLRVIVDGVEVGRWLNEANTAATKVWVNLDWQAAQSGALAASMGTGAISVIGVSGDITNFPASGLLEIGSELFAYSGKDTAVKQFTGVTRAARGTTAASHTAGDAVRWIQHDIWIEYGSSSPEIPVGDLAAEPMFSMLVSSNTSWVYGWFYSTSYPARPAAWAFTNLRNTVNYGGNQASTSLTHAELGISDDCADTGSKQEIEGYWSLFNPCGIVSANFQNGEYYYSRTGWTTIRIRSSVNGASYTTNYTVPVSVKDVWTAWSQNATLLAGAQYVQLHMSGWARDIRRTRVEAGDVTLTLDSNFTPTVTIGEEQTSYRLQGTLTNTTTGDVLEVDFGMDLDESLEINTDTHDVTSLTDNSPQYQALNIVGGSRKHLLRLQPGANTLKYEEAGLVDVDIDIEFERRWRV